MTPIDLKPHFAEPGFRELIEPLVAGEIEKRVFETDHQRRNGTLYPVEVHLQAMTWDGQEVLVAIILDISEGRQAQVDLRRSYEQLEDTVLERTRQLRRSEEQLRAAKEGGRASHSRQDSSARRRQP